jgi:RNA polymerase sigma-70 factor (ECF subfamily)
VIVRAQGEGPDAQRALGDLIKRYEHTVVMMFRAHRPPRDTDPEDLKQAFFTGMIARQDVLKLDPHRGRFRSWLRVAVRNFMINYRKHHFTRFGQTDPTAFEVQHGCTPELMCMRQFAEDTLLHALQRHRAESRDPEQFDRLLRFLPGPELDASELAALAAAWNVPRNRLAVQVYELREKHKRILHGLVADTLDVDPSDPEGGAAIALEMRELYRLLCEVPRESVLPEDA